MSEMSRQLAAANDLAEQVEKFLVGVGSRTDLQVALGGYWSSKPPPRRVGD